MDLQQLAMPQQDLTKQFPKKILSIGGVIGSLPKARETSTGGRADRHNDHCEKSNEQLLRPHTSHMAVAKKIHFTPVNFEAALPKRIVFVFCGLPADELQKANVVN